jgi:tetratricopeptide (TPR) repeat protein
MKRAILVGLAMVCLVIYLVLLNGESVDFRLASSWIVHWNVGALIGGAFVAGVLATLAVVTVQSGYRAWREWRSGRIRRRSSRIDQWLETGEQLIWNGDVARGRALLQRAWQRQPESPYAVLALAASFQDTGESHRARGVLFDAAAQQHTNPDILLALAEAHRQAGELGPRLDVLERLRALHPRAPRVLRALRDAYSDLERWQEAAATQEAYLAEAREGPQVALERDRLLQLRYLAAVHSSDPATGLTILEDLAASRAAPVPVLVSLGDALRRMGRTDEAAAVWERGLRTTPRSVFVERLCALATETRHHERIRTLLRKMRPGSVDQDALHLWNARLHLADHATEDAARELASVTAAFAPAVYHRQWAEVHRQRGQLQQALTEQMRAGETDSYVCRRCDRPSREWAGVCPGCQSWDSLRSTAELALVER